MIKNAHVPQSNWGPQINQRIIWTEFIVMLIDQRHVFGTLKFGTKQGLVCPKTSQTLSSLLSENGFCTVSSRKFSTKFDLDTHVFRNCWQSSSSSPKPLIYYGRSSEIYATVVAENNENLFI